MSSNLFDRVEMAPRDPILGLTEAFNADTRPTKVNLGVGVYYDDTGKIPILEAVREAEIARSQTSAPRGYLPMEGLAAYDSAVQKLLFGESSPLIRDGRLITAQALGGTGALKIGADLLKRINPNATVLISDPSWENHRALFEGAGFPVKTYPYYDAAMHSVNFEDMEAALRNAGPDSIVVLHACCHNPTGVDLVPEQWKVVAQVARERNFIPFIDIAYQGFAEGLDADSVAVRFFAETGVPFLVSSSFSKSFSLYGERVGALTIVATSKDEAARLLSQLKRVIRTNYSNPPTHGGVIVSAILNDARLHALWEKDLAGMRDRIKEVRQHFVYGMAARGVTRDFSFVLKQRGMFSYSGLTSAQVERLQKEFGVYAVASGRICVAALNSKNIEYALDSIAAVLKS
jgi:aromatic-amino-acid transaminase